MPTCVKCGAKNPTIHITQSFDGIADRRDYCEACFDPVELKAELKEAARAGNEPQFKAAFDAQVQKIENALGPKLEELCEFDPRFSREAYEFVLKSLFYALMKDAILPQHSRCHSRHATARELIDAGQIYARETWGTSAKAQLKRWGIETSSDVGDVVFLLVENGFLGRRPDDNRSDFDHLPFLADNT
jgi:uncharacterized repeat protein (TIGR04138 family)